MLSFLSVVGSSILTSIINLLKNKAVRFGIIFGLFYFLISIIDFKIALPQDVYDVLVSSFVKDFFTSLTFFFPLTYAFKCIAILLLSKYFNIIINILKNVYRIIVGSTSEN